MPMPSQTIALADLGHTDSELILGVPSYDRAADTRWRGDANTGWAELAVENFFSTMAAEVADRRTQDEVDHLVGVLRTAFSDLPGLAVVNTYYDPRFDDPDRDRITLFAQDGFDADDLAWVWLKAKTSYEHALRHMEARDEVKAGTARVETVELLRGIYEFEVVVTKALGLVITLTHRGKAISEGWWSYSGPDAMKEIVEHSEGEWRKALDVGATPDEIAMSLGCGWQRIARADKELVDA